MFLLVFCCISNISWIYLLLISLRFIWFYARFCHCLFVLVHVRFFFWVYFSKIGFFFVIIFLMFILFCDCFCKVSFTLRLLPLMFRASFCHFPFVLRFSVTFLSFWTCHYNVTFVSSCLHHVSFVVVLSCSSLFELICHVSFV